MTCSSQDGTQLNSGERGVAPNGTLGLHVGTGVNRPQVFSVHLDSLAGVARRSCSWCVSPCSCQAPGRCGWGHWGRNRHFLSVLQRALGVWVATAAVTDLGGTWSQPPGWHAGWVGALAAGAVPVLRPFLRTPGRACIGGSSPSVSSGESSPVSCLHVGATALLAFLGQEGRPDAGWPRSSLRTVSGSLELRLPLSWQQR